MNSTSLSPGDKLGPYEILEPIGKGGMGEVYRARDERLTFLLNLADELQRRFAAAGN